MQLSVIIPAFNEAQTIERAVKETDAYFGHLFLNYELLVVDDGSTDQTAELVEKLRATHPRLRLIKLPTNRGKGAAVASGVLASQGDWIVFLDADLSTAPEEFAKFLPCLDRYDILIGSRVIAGAKIPVRQPFYRVLSGKFFNLLIRLFLNLPFHDTQCGFKAFAAKAKPLFQNMRTTRWVFDVEILYRAKQKGLAIREVPITWEHRPASRVRLTDFWHIIKELRQIKK